jgi:nucleotide-binding universal stress UspA family protein
MSRVRRVIAGVSGSPRSLSALRCAGDLAHAHDAALFPVHAWAPPAIALAGHQFLSEYLRQAWEEAARQRLWDALEAAFGGLPPGIRAEPVIAPGNPGWVLVRAAARADDLLVIGAGRRGDVNRLWRQDLHAICTRSASLLDTREFRCVTRAHARRGYR